MKSLDLAPSDQLGHHNTNRLFTATPATFNGGLSGPLSDAAVSFLSNTSSKCESVISNLPIPDTTPTSNRRLLNQDFESYVYIFCDSSAYEPTRIKFMWTLKGMYGAASYST